MLNKEHTSKSGMPKEEDQASEGRRRVSKEQEERGMCGKVIGACNLRNMALEVLKMSVNVLDAL